MGWFRWLVREPLPKVAVENGSPNLRQPLHDLGAIGKDRHLAAARIALALQGLQRSRLKLELRCVSGREIAAWARAAPAAAASCNNDLDASSSFRLACANMRGIDAYDEFTFRVIRQVQLHLAAFSVHVADTGS